MRKTPIKKKPVFSKDWDLERRKGSKPQSNFKQLRNYNSVLVYSPHAKRMISKVPDLMKTFNSLFFSLELKPIRKLSQLSQTLSEKVLVLKDGTKVRASLEKLDPFSKNSHITNSFFIFKIESPKSTNTYFVKYTRPNYKEYGTNEMIGLDVIRKAGFNVIPAHFSYVNKKENVSFIFYRFQRKLIDAEKAFKEGILNKQDVSYIKYKLRHVERKVNYYFQKEYDSLNVSKNFMIADVFPHPSKSFFSLPVFVDPKTKKLFLYDPLFIPIRK